MTDNDIVFFLMPDGTKVSNDPRWAAQQAVEAQEAALAAVPYSGNEGVHTEDQAAQIGGGLAPGQSGQPGVGESPAATFDEMVSGQLTGRDIQVKDTAQARAQDADPENPLIPAPEPKDSNEAVSAARQARADAAKAALAEVGESEGDPSVPYSEWSAKQLKAEAMKRNASRGEGGQLDLAGVKTKSQLAEVLEADDEAQANPSDPSGGLN